MGSKIETGKKEIDELFLPKLASVFKLDEGKLKSELISEKIAYKLYQCTDEVLPLAKEMVRYIRQKSVKQTKTLR